MSRTARRPSYANVTATLALVVALGGGGAAVAAGLAKNSVGSPQIKDGQVRTADLAGNAVTGPKVKNESLTGADLKDATLRNVLVRASPTTSNVTMTGGDDVAATVVLQAPAAGFVVLTGQAVFDSRDADSYVHVTVRRDGADVFDSDWDTGDVDTYFDQAQSATAVVPVTPGKHTFELVVRETAAQTPSRFYNGQLIAQYVAAGSVDPD